MKEITGDLFEQVDMDAICITTNGYVSASGHNTMGAGCAGEAKKRWPGIDLVLGQMIRQQGNRVHMLTVEDGEDRYPLLLTKDGSFEPLYHLVAYPTKAEKVTEWDELLPRYQGQYDEHLPVEAPGWMGLSLEGLVMLSALQLRDLATSMGWHNVCLPRPGCGLGGLKWDDIKKKLGQLLDDRFFVIHGR